MSQAGIPFSLRPAGTRLGIVAMGLLLAGCTPRPGHVRQPNMWHLVQVNRTPPPELSGRTALTSATPAPPAAQDAHP
ncbi:hypothetical protein B0W47_10455 [Komagataeibacter nataicola]|uniref:Uncharacterized protein n=1 Tax=Komagataeibacter nataicola TaxID=265960 RepID=A0A9N7CHU5_9PROT|nr:hypothetical protein [Komagataeibacter nataicola]AQU87830.1 hypothetical protein B0W47_10455 [Komagataeibacter nataicola]PYD66225.1 hypothetical protein CDI09_09505 [Komagataeibacter nataicola]WEQ55555.1 hypothetical protein LV564_16040 [Komagataeibacter nataicola]WNM09575.1 hypothetical protein RI056_06455 [Komagataeibacter nataicola]GBR25301.1 hypothetical protein AA0616_2946 [Komagataeibacter nataicola NRIC 0616]